MELRVLDWIVGVLLSLVAWVSAKQVGRIDKLEESTMSRSEIESLAKRLTDDVDKLVETMQRHELQDRETRGEIFALIRKQGEDLMAFQKEVIRGLTEVQVQLRQQRD